MVIWAGWMSEEEVFAYLAFV